MTQRHPFRGRRVSRLILMLAWLMVAPAYADQHTPSAPEVQPAPEAGKQALEKIVEARGRARAKRYPEALNQLDDAISLAERMEDKLPLALALHNVAEIRLLKGEILDALKAYYRALGVYTELGNKAGAGIVQGRIGTLSRLIMKPRETAAPAAENVASVKTEDRLSPIDEAVERVRLRKQSRGEDTVETASPGPVRVIRSEVRPVDDPVGSAYVETLRRKISGNSRYPDYARRKGQEGSVDLAFAVGKDGDVTNVELLKSSGFVSLDVEALRNVRESAPFGPVPNGTAPASLTVRLTFSYELSAAADTAP